MHNCVRRCPNTLAPEPKDWIEKASDIGTTGRWEALNKRLVRLFNQPGEADRILIQVCGALCASIFSEYLAMKREYEDSNSGPPLIAWRARNLLELSVWSIYCSKSNENARRLYADGGRDVINLINAFAKWTEVAGRGEPEVKPIELEKTELAKRAALQGVESLEGAYKQVSEAAKEIGMGANFSVANKMLSKFAHPTAMQIMGTASKDKLALQKLLFHSHGCLCFTGAFNALESTLFKVSGR
jgi:Family of unknown function (DUF5677)